MYRRQEQLLALLVGELQERIRAGGDPPPGKIDAQRLHNSLITMLEFLQPSTETLTFVLALLQHEVLTAKLQALKKE